MGYDTIAQRFVEEAPKDDPDYEGKPKAPIHHRRLMYAAESWRTDLPTLYSYGTHFPMLQLVRNDHGEFWLLNSDYFSQTTSTHQSVARRAAQRDERPLVELPFTVLDRAEINHSGLYLVDHRPHSTTETKHASPNREDAPKWVGWTMRWTDNGRVREALPPGEDGMYRWTSYDYDHGGTVFGYGDTHYVTAWDKRVHDWSRFGGYFMAELPRKVTGVSDALDALMPQAVRNAIAIGHDVQRQGDFFAVPSSFNTRTLRALAEGAPIRRMESLAGTRHRVTETITVSMAVQHSWFMEQVTFGRGVMWHHCRGGEDKNEGRTKMRLGDGKTWHAIHRNLVPIGADGEPRAWKHNNS